MVWSTENFDWRVNNQVNFLSFNSVNPGLSRKIRAKLNETAEKASIEVFCKNLRNLLLTPSCRDVVIIGLDPGYKYCKCAVISTDGSILDTGIIHPKFRGDQNPLTLKDKNALVKMIESNGVSVIAIGNGTACRETESMVARLIKSKEFGNPDIKYTIVSEQGASIYRYENVKFDASSLDYVLCFPAAPSLL